MNTDASYNYSVLLTKAYRTLRVHVYECLEKYELIPTHWSLLGIVYKAKDGITLSDAATMLGVKLPLVTIMVDFLAKKQLIERVSNVADGRSKLLVPTKTGHAKILEIEEDINRSLAPLLVGISPDDLHGFQKVLSTIIDNNNQ
jgi:DNA-binding MarR family transcriptional regulator